MNIEQDASSMAFLPGFIRGPDGGEIVIPSVPRMTSITNAFYRLFTLGWVIPASSGGALITGYHVRFRQKLTIKAPWQTILADVGVEYVWPDEVIPVGATFEMQVAAENSAGIGPYCVVVEAKSENVPGIPREFYALGISSDPDTDTAEGYLHFDPPESDGGSPILNYKLEWRVQGEVDWIEKILSADSFTQANYSANIRDKIATSPIPLEYSVDLTAHIITVTRGETYDCLLYTSPSPRD